MSIVTVTKNRYRVDPPLYQWDTNQVLEIYGLSLPVTPEIHFTNDAINQAIVRESSVDNAGVIRADIPNSLLQKPYKIIAYVCIYEDIDTFKSLYKIEIPVIKRNKPKDYNDSDINIDLEEITVTANGTYVADNGYDAIKKVVVNVVPKLQSKTVTENGTVTPDSGYDGLSKVTVNVDTSVALQDKVITENGTYSADSSYDGLGNVTVNVETEPTLQNKTITENGTYKADSGYDGLGEVSVEIATSYYLHFTESIMFNTSLLIE